MSISYVCTTTPSPRPLYNVLTFVNSSSPSPSSLHPDCPSGVDASGLQRRQGASSLRDRQPPPRCLPLTALPPAGMGHTTGQRTSLPFGLHGEPFSRCEEAPQVLDQGAICPDSMDLRRAPASFTACFAGNTNIGGKKGRHYARFAWLLPPISSKQRKQAVILKAVRRILSIFYRLFLQIGRIGGKLAFSRQKAPSILPPVSAKTGE